MLTAQQTRELMTRYKSECLTYTLASIGTRIHEAALTGRTQIKYVHGEFSTNLVELLRNKGYTCWRDGSALLISWEDID